MNKKEVKEWIEFTDNAGYIDCQRDIYDTEFDFIMNIAKELLKMLKE